MLQNFCAYSKEFNTGALNRLACQYYGLKNLEGVVTLSRRVWWAFRVWHIVKPQKSGACRPHAHNGPSLIALQAFERTSHTKTQTHRLPITIWVPYTRVRFIRLDCQGYFIKRNTALNSLRWKCRLNCLEIVCFEISIACAKIEFSVSYIKLFYLNRILKETPLKISLRSTCMSEQFFCKTGSCLICKYASCICTEPLSKQF